MWYVNCLGLTLYPQDWEWAKVGREEVLLTYNLDAQQQNSQFPSHNTSLVRPGNNFVQNNEISSSNFALLTSPEQIWTIETSGGFPSGSDGKESACNTGDLDSVPESGRSPGEGNGNPSQYSCLENAMDKGAWQATVHGVTRVGHDLVTKPPP